MHLLSSKLDASFISGTSLNKHSTIKREKSSRTLNVVGNFSVHYTPKFHKCVMKTKGNYFNQATHLRKI